MKNHDDVIQEAMRLARTPAGQKLIQTLQHQGGSELQGSIQKAKSGDIQEIQCILSRLMEDPEAKKLLDQLLG